jgi:hypothetical protein
LKYENETANRGRMNTHPVCFVIILRIIFVYFCFFLEIEVLNEIVYFEVYPPLLGIKEHFFGFYDIEFTCSQISG